MFANKTLQCGGLPIKNPKGTEPRKGMWRSWLKQIWHLVLALSSYVYREVQVSGIDNHHLPHGYLDMMICAIHKKEVFIAIKDYESHSIAGVSHSEVGRLSITSANRCVLLRWCLIIEENAP